MHEKRELQWECMDTTSKMNPYALGGVAIVAIVIIGALIYFYGGSSTGDLGSLESSLEQASTPEISVPTTVNPINEVLPDETAFDKTNPFNETYANPFE